VKLFLFEFAGFFVLIAVLNRNIGERRWAKKVVRRSCGDASQAEFISFIGFTGSVSKTDSITAMASERNRAPFNLQVAAH